ncbi:antitoxin Xre/MbcA/ParS toxin-binding domain-containing protein [Chitinimonas sp.]|uniref:antitoxin Xre/MbcA/ParS toxin-binding domain-containing protein n=1 Tax=Chitinimonas sp. TaxID=1934313 RepID=UPI0035AE1B2C
MDESNHEEALTLPLLAYAAKVLGSEDKARAWLESHNAVLGGKPVDVAAGVDGESRVRAVLLKIEHGMSV